MRAVGFELLHRLILAGIGQARGSGTAARRRSIGIVPQLRLWIPPQDTARTRVLAEAIHSVRGVSCSASLARVRRLPCAEVSVEHGVLGFDERGVRVVDRERGVVVGTFGRVLRVLEIVCGAAVVHVLAHVLHVFVPRPSHVVPRLGDLASWSSPCVRAAASAWVCAGFARVLHVLFESGLRLRLARRPLGPRPPWRAWRTS